MNLLSCYWCLHDGQLMKWKTNKITFSYGEKIFLPKVDLLISCMWYLKLAWTFNEVWNKYFLNGILCLKDVCAPIRFVRGTYATVNLINCSLKEKFYPTFCRVPLILERKKWLFFEYRISMQHGNSTSTDNQSAFVRSCC